MAGPGGGVRCATCRRDAPGWSEGAVETIDAIARLVALAVGLPGTPPGANLKKGLGERGEAQVDRHLVSD